MILTQSQVSLKLTHILEGSQIQRIVDAFERSRFKLYLVGGCVRDTFLGRTPKDFDLCTDAKPDEIKEILKSAKIQCTERGAHFGVVVAKLDEDVEIATLRADIFQSTGDNKNTKVIIGVSMAEDVARRDFTINALFYDFKEKQVIDLVGGIQDLEDGVIRAVGDPNMRFIEDNLRKLRAVRFATRYNFIIEFHTMCAIVQCPDLKVSKERVVEELENIYKGCAQIHNVVRLLNTTGLVEHIFEGIEVRDYHEAMARVQKITSFDTLIAVLIMTDKQLRKKLFGLKFSSKTCDGVALLKDWTDCQIASAFQRKLASTDLTLASMMVFDETGNSDLLKHFFTYKIPEKTVELLQDAGYEKEVLGQALKQIQLHAKSKLLAC